MISDEVDFRQGILLAISRKLANNKSINLKEKKPSKMNNNPE